MKKHINVAPTPKLRSHFVGPSARSILKFRAAHWTFKRIILFAEHCYSTTKANANIAFWAMEVCSMNALAAHIAESCQATVSHWFRLLV
jgi:hypothetical protein